MEKKSIGTFLAALRKANGYTQEEVAQRLFVSNKTVSKWERDESSPDLATIPVLAELFGVTCDEILRGERIPQGTPDEGKGRAKVERQARYIVNRTVSQFVSISCVAAALTVLGLVCHFTITYTYFKSKVAFAVTMLFLLASVVVEIIQFNRGNSALKESSLLDENAHLSAAPLRLFRRIAFAVFMGNVWVCILIWPIINLTSIYFEVYLEKLPALLVICLLATGAAVYFARKWLGVNMDKQVWIPRLRFTTDLLKRTARAQGIFLCLLLPYLIITSAVIDQLNGSMPGGSIVPLAIFTAGMLCIIILLVRVLRLSKKSWGSVLILLLTARNILFGILLVVAFQLYYLNLTSISELLFRGIPEVFFKMALITIVYLAFKISVVKKYNGNQELRAVSQD